MSQQFGVFATGGSIGHNNSNPLQVGTKEDMMQVTKRLRKQLTPGEKSYYKMGFSVRQITCEVK